jgi:hypothetical protein
LIYVVAENTFYVNFESLYVRSSEQIKRIQLHVEKEVVGVVWTGYRFL